MSFLLKISPSESAGRERERLGQKVRLIFSLLSRREFAGRTMQIYSHNARSSCLSYSRSYARVRCAFGTEISPQLDSIFKLILGLRHSTPFAINTFFVTQPQNPRESRLELCHCTFLTPCSGHGLLFPLPGLHITRHVTKGELNTNLLHGRSLDELDQF